MDKLDIEEIWFSPNKSDHTERLEDSIELLNGAFEPN